MAKQTWKAQSVSVRVGGRKDEEELLESSWSTAGFSVVHPSVLVSSNWCSRSHSSLEDPPLALFNRVITA